VIAKYFLLSFLPQLCFRQSLEAIDGSKAKAVHIEYKYFEESLGSWDI
jgi:hypothetical protein